MRRHGLTLLEVVLAVVLLAGVVAACAPVLRLRAVDGAGDRARGGPVVRVGLPAGAAEGSGVRTDSTIGRSTRGSWRVVADGSVSWVSWVPDAESGSVGVGADP